MKRILVSLVFCLACVISTNAMCDCFEMPDHRGEFRKSNAVFIGEVIKIENPSADKREELPDRLRNELGDKIYFKVTKIWKGSKTSQIIWTHATHDLCSKWKFEVGKKYLVYVQKIKGIRIGAEFCSRTRPLETTDEEKIKELNELDTY